MAFCCLRTTTIAARLKYALASTVLANADQTRKSSFTFRYALAFDAGAEDLASLVLSSASATSTNEMTVEYWLYVGDRWQDKHTTFFYSVYDSSQVPIYDQANELSQHFTHLDGVRHVRGKALD